MIALGVLVTLVGGVSMLALGVVQRAGTVEPIVEVRVQVVGLVREHRAKRAAVGRESPVPLVHVVAVSDSGGDGTIRVGRNTSLNTRPILPLCGSTPVAKRARSLRVFAVNESEHGLFHISVVRWAEGFDQRLPVNTGPVMPQPAKAKAASYSRLNGCVGRTLL